MRAFVGFGAAIWLFASFTPALLIRNEIITYQARIKIDSVNTHYGVLNACLLGPDFKLCSDPMLTFDKG